MNQKKQPPFGLRSPFFLVGVLLLLLIWILAWGFVISEQKDTSSFQQKISSSAVISDPPFNLSSAITTTVLTHPNYPHHHAAQFVMGSPVPHLIWFAGSREGAKDVVLLHSRFINQQWTMPQVLLTREQLEKHLHMYIKKLGNAVGAYDSNGRFHLWVTHVSLGGWASARIAHLTIKNPDFSSHSIFFNTAHNLYLSGFLNISYLVRHPPIIENNQFVLPIYHELYDKYPALLWQQFDGTVTRLTEITQAKSYFQGALVKDSSSNTDRPSWWLYLRPYALKNGQQVIALHSEDKGNSWSKVDEPASRTQLNNPNSGIAAVIQNNQHVVATNLGLTDRSRLVFASGSAPAQLTQINDIATGKDSRERNPEFSYPALYEQSNTLWLAYTQDRKQIVVKTFK